MFRKFFSLLLMVFLILMSVAAFAQVPVPVAPTAASGTWDVILQTVIYIVGLFVSAIVAVMIPLLALYLKKKWNLNITDAQTAMVDDLLAKGINYAEEQALKAAKIGSPPAAGSSAEKLKTALDFVVKQIDALGLPQKAADELEKLIEAKLNATRADIPAASTPPAAPVPQVPIAGQG